MTWCPSESLVAESQWRLPLSVPLTLKLDLFWWCLFKDVMWWWRTVVPGQQQISQTGSGPAKLRESYHFLWRWTRREADVSLRTWWDDDCVDVRDADSSSCWIRGSLRCLVCLCFSCAHRGPGHLSTGRQSTWSSCCDLRDSLSSSSNCSGKGGSEGWVQAVYLWLWPPPSKEIKGGYKEKEEWRS